MILRHRVSSFDQMPLSVQCRSLIMTSYDRNLMWFIGRNKECQISPRRDILPYTDASLGDVTLLLYLISIFAAPSSLCNAIKPRIRGFSARQYKLYSQISHSGLLCLFVFVLFHFLFRHFQVVQRLRAMGHGGKKWTSLEWTALTVRDGRPGQGRIEDFHWVGAAGPGGAVLAIEGAPLIDQN